MLWTLKRQNARRHKTLGFKEPFESRLFVEETLSDLEVGSYGESFLVD